MKLFICIDKNGGLTFGGRRLSSDSVVRKKIFEIIKKKSLFVNSFSAQQFEEGSRLTVCEDFITKMGKEDFCFIENIEINTDLFEEIYVFNWNRNYPADKYFNIDLKTSGYKKISAENFTGTSHDKITLTHYGR